MRFSSTLIAACLLALAGHAVAEDFSFKDLKGKDQRLVDYRGKWVLVNFWATWCAPCREEIPDLVSLHNAHKDKDLVVIGVALDSTKPSVLEFAAEQSISYPLVFGNHKMSKQVGDVDVLPTSYLYDPTGKLVSYQAGVISRESVEGYVNSKAKK